MNRGYEDASGKAAFLGFFFCFAQKLLIFSIQAYFSCVNQEDLLSFWTPTMANSMHTCNIHCENKCCMTTQRIAQYIADYAFILEPSFSKIF